MSLPYFPLYPKDFEAKTSHLTMLEDGAYNRLMRLCWMTPGCSLPDDEAWIMRRMRAVSEDEIAAVRAVLDEFFTRDGEIGWSCDFIEESCEQFRKSERRPWIPLSVQRGVWRRDGGRCRYCSTYDGPFHLDHVIPWSRGGAHTVENLVVSCAACNWAKGDRTPEEMGWRL